MKITDKQWRAALERGRKKRCIHELDVLGKVCGRISAGQGELRCDYYDSDRRKCPDFKLDTR
jgi:hypothetical protein